jgi:hypothetical protein
MPFINFRHFDTGIRGWTRPLDGHRPFAPAALIRFTPKLLYIPGVGVDLGDLAWIHNAKRPCFLAWGEQCVIGSHWGFDLPGEWQWGLPRCDLETRREWSGNASWLEAA